MAAPTYVGHYQPTSSWVGGLSRSISAIPVNVGDRLLCYAFNGDGSVALNTPTTSAAGLSGWALVDDEAGFANYSAVRVWTATVDAAPVGGTIDVTVTTPSSTPKWHFGVVRFSAAGSPLAFGSTHVDSTGGPTLTGTQQQASSALLVVNADWDRLSGSTRTWRTSGVGAVTELAYTQTASGAGFTGYVGLHQNAGAVGSKTVGLSAPTGQKFSIVAVEIPGLSLVDKTDTDTATVVLTDTALTDLKVKGGASDTATFTATESTQILVPTSKVASDTAAFTATESVLSLDRYVLRAPTDTATFFAIDDATRTTQAPTLGSWVSPPVALPEEAIAGSLFYYRARVPEGTALLFETSIDNGASWQEATNRGPVPGLPVGSESVKAVLVRAIFARPNAEVESPELHRLELRVATDSTHDVWCQLGRFRLQDSEVVDSDAGVTIRLSGSDMARNIARNTWDESLVIPAGTNVRDAIMIIVSNRWPEATFNLPSTEFTTPRLFYGPGIGTGNPWADVRKLAMESAGWELFPDAYGVITGRPVPDPDTQPAVFDFNDDQRPTMRSVTRRMTDQNTYNQVLVIAQSTSIEEAVYALWRDTDPTSRTRVDGDYGTVTKTIRTDKAANAEQCQVVADAEGRAVKGATEVVRLSALAAPFLDPGDVVGIDRRRSRTTGRFLVDGWHYPLGPEALMDLNTRRQRA